MNLSRRQLTLITFVIVIFALLIWQISQLIQDDIRFSPVTEAQAAPPAKIAKTAEIAVPIQHTPTREIKPTPSHLKPEDNKYLALVNRYKFAKLQHQVLQEELAIANTRAKIAKLANEDDAFNSFDNSTFGTGDDSTQKTNTPPKLVYLDHQNGLWSATLSTGNHFQQITQGSELADGSRVVKITKNGIVIQSKSKGRYNLNFSGITPLATNLASNENYPDNKPKKKPTRPEPKTHAIEKKIVLHHRKASTINKAHAAKTPPMLHLKPTLKIKKKSRQIKRKHSLDETVLLEMPATSYTIKLRESINKQQVTEFIKQHKLGNRTLCYSHRTNRNIYTLVYGDYLTSSAARNAMKKLPKALQNDLTILQLKEIQQEIQDAS